MQRLFIIAPSVARLIRKEREGERVIEGYFPDHAHRSTFVQNTETGSSLILEAGNGTSEERADLPLAHAQALLAVSHGKVEYVRTRLLIGAHEIQVLHFVRPGTLDLVSVANPPEDEQDLPSLPWFGPEVSAELAYQRRRLALDCHEEADWRFQEGSAQSDGWLPVCDEVPGCSHEDPFLRRIAHGRTLDLHDIEVTFHDPGPLGIPLAGQPAEPNGLALDP